MLSLFHEGLTKITPDECDAAVTRIIGNRAKRRINEFVNIRSVGSACEAEAGEQ